MVCGCALHPIWVFPEIHPVCHPSAVAISHRQQVHLNLLTFDLSGAWFMTGIVLPHRSRIYNTWHCFCIGIDEDGRNFRCLQQYSWPATAPPSDSGQRFSFQEVATFTSQLSGWLLHRSDQWNTHPSVNHSEKFSCQLHLLGKLWRFSGFRRSKLCPSDSIISLCVIFQTPNCSGHRPDNTPEIIHYLSNCCSTASGQDSAWFDMTDTGWKVKANIGWKFAIICHSNTLLFIFCIHGLIILNTQSMSSYCPSLILKNTSGCTGFFSLIYPLQHLHLIRPQWYHFRLKLNIFALSNNPNIFCYLLLISWRVIRRFCRWTEEILSIWLTR